MKDVSTCISYSSSWIPKSVIFWFLGLFILIGTGRLCGQDTPHPGVFLELGKEGSGPWQTYHPADDLTALVGEGGTALRVPDGKVLFRWARWGREDASHEVGQILDVERSPNRLEVRRNAGWERLDNLKGGLKQSFIVNEAPAETGDTLVLWIDVAGEMRVGDVEPEAITLTRDGREAMRYEDLQVFDAKKRKLSAKFVAAEGFRGFRIEIDDRDAIYPIEVDPIFRPLGTPGFLGGVKSDQLQLEKSGATVVAVDRDLCLVGVPGYDLAAGIDVSIADEANGFTGSSVNFEDERLTDSALTMARFGMSLLTWLEGETILEDVGAVFVFRLRDGVWLYEDILNDWNHAIRMHRSPTPSNLLEGARFGETIEIGPTGVLVGAPSTRCETWINVLYRYLRIQWDFESGAVYFFQRPDGEQGFSAPQAWRTIDSELGEINAGTGLGGTRYVNAGHQIALGHDLALVAMGEGFDPFEFFADANDYSTDITKFAVFDHTGGQWQKRPDLSTSADFDQPLVSLSVGPEDRFAAAFDQGDGTIELVELNLDASLSSFDPVRIGSVNFDPELQVSWGELGLFVGCPSQNKIECYHESESGWVLGTTLIGDAEAVGFGRHLTIQGDVLVTTQEQAGDSLVQLWHRDETGIFAKVGEERFEDRSLSGMAGDGHTLALITATDTIDALRFDRQIRGVMLKPDGQPLANARLALDRGGMIVNAHANRLVNGAGRTWTSRDRPWKLNNWWGCDLRFWVPDDLPFLDAYRLEVDVTQVDPSLLGRRITAYASLPLQNYEWGGETRFDTPGFGMGTAVLNEGTLSFELWEGGFRDYAQRLGLGSVGEWSIRFAIQGPEGAAPANLVEIGEARLILEEIEAQQGLITTDAEGRFELSDLTASRYRVRPEGLDYRVDSGWIDLQHVPVASGLEVNLQGNLAVAGTLSTLSGQPIEGAVIRCSGQSFTTDAEGAFRFEQVAPGGNPLAVDAPWTAADGGPIAITVDPANPLSRSLDLSAVATQTPFTIELRDASGAPLPGIRTRVTGPFGYEVELASNSLGLIELSAHQGEGSGLYQGTYQVVALDETRDWPRGGLMIDFDGSAGFNATFQAVGASFEVTLRHGGEIWTNRPVRLAREIGSVAETRTASTLNGGNEGLISHPSTREIELTSVEITADGYELLDSILIRHDGGSADLALDSGTLTAETYVLVGPGGDELNLGPASIELLYQSGRFLTRALRSEAWLGRPAAGTYRLLLRSSNFRAMEALDAWILELETTRFAVDNEVVRWTDSTGIAAADDLPGGDYFMLAADPDSGRPLEALDPGLWRQSWDRITVTSGLDGAADISVSRRNLISGRLTHSGESLAGVRVEARIASSGELLAQAESDLNGNFLLERVPSATVDLSFQRAGFTFSGDGLNDHLLVDDWSGIRVEGLASGVVSGQLAFDDPELGGGVRIALRSVTRTFTATAGPFQGGAWQSFELPIDTDALIGSLEVLVETSDANEITELVHPDGTVVRLETYNTEAGERRLFADAFPTMKNDAQVSGREEFAPLDPLAALRGKPLGGTWTLRIYGTYTGTHQLRQWEIRAEALMNSGRAEERQQITATDGSYRFTGVAPGFYEVEVLGDRFQIENAIIPIDNSLGTEVALIHPSDLPTVGVLVSDSEGLPLAGVTTSAEIDGATYQAQTDSNGVAWIELPTLSDGRLTLEVPEGSYAEPDIRNFVVADIGGDELTFTLLPQEVVSLNFANPVLTHPASFSADLLEASAPIPGTFEFSLAEGAALEVGENSFTWSFIPDDERRYARQQGERTLVVIRATPQIEIVSASRSYDGTAQLPSVLTNPEGLPVESIFSTGETPVEPGTYEVTLRVDTPEYFGEVVTTWTIQRGSVDLSFPEAIEGRIVRTLGHPAASLTLNASPQGWWVMPDGTLRIPENRGSLVRMPVPVQSSSQSTTLWGYPASNALDGFWWTYSHTVSNDPAPRWQVNLSESLEPDVLRLLNRTGNRQRLSDISLRMWDIDDQLNFEANNLNPNNALNSPNRIDIEPAWRRTVGQVEVTRDPTSDFGGIGVLSLAEVEFLSRSSLPLGSDLGLTSLANRVVWQSPTSFPPPGNGYPDFAFDGDPDSFTHTVANASQDARWAVDWEEPMLLESIRLYNRQGCCAERLRDLRIEIYQDGELSWTSEMINPGNALNGPSFIDIDLRHSDGSPRLGSSLQVVRTPDPTSSGDDASVLSLGEVTILGGSLPRFTPTLSFESNPPGSYGPSAEMPTQAGAYKVTAVIDTPRHFAQKSVDFLIVPEEVTITFPEAEAGEIRFVYDATAAPVSVATTPAGVNVEVVYEGTTRGGEPYGPTVEAPISAGTYTVSATIQEEGFSGSANARLVINPQPFTLANVEDASIPRAGDMIDLEDYLTGNGGELDWSLTPGQQDLARPITSWRIFGLDAAILGAPTSGIDGVVGPFAGAAILPGGRAVGWTRTSGRNFEMAGATAVASAYEDFVWVAMTNGKVRFVSASSGAYLESPFPAGLQAGVVKMAGGNSHVALLDSAGKVGAFVRFDEGHGLGSLPAGLAEAEVVQIASGSRHLLALDSTGQLFAWGDNASGQIALPDFGGQSVVAIAADGESSAALLANGDLIAWGAYTNGPVNQSSWGHIALGSSQVYAIDDTEAVVGASNIPAGLDSGVVDIRAHQNAALAMLRTSSVDLIQAGTLTGTVRSSGDANTLGGELSFELSIQPQLIDLTLDGLTEGTIERIYNGSAATLPVVGTSAGELSASFEYSGTSYDGNRYGPTTEPPTDAGNYVVNAQISDPNFEGELELPFVIAKATLEPALVGLSETYDGSAIEVSVNGIPQGVTVDINYNGSSSAPILPGEYAVRAEVDDPNYTGLAESTLTIAKATQSLSVGQIDSATFASNLSRVLVTETDQGLPVEAEVIEGPGQIVSGQLEVLDAGTIRWRLSQAGDERYLPLTIEREWTVNTATATVTLSVADGAVYSGQPQAVLVSTNPAGLPVRVRYNGSDAVPQNAGTYSVQAEVVATGYAGSSTASFTIAKAEASLFWQGLDQVYDGTRREVNIFSNPPGLELDIHYDVEPINAGVIQVTVSAEGPNHLVEETRDLLIQKRPQVLTFPQPENATYGDGPIPLGASVDSALAVSYRLLSGVGNGATLVGDSLVAERAGTFQIIAEQNGDANHERAEAIIRNVTVERASIPIQINLPENPVYNELFHTATAVSSDETKLAAASLTITYNDSLVPPSDAGTYTVRAYGENDRYFGEATAILTVARATPVFEVVGNPKYTGSTLTPLISITPTDVNYQISYPGQLTPPVDAGTYMARITVDETNYFLEQDFDFTIDPAFAQVIGLTTQYSYTGREIHPQITTNPEGLEIDYGFTAQSGEFANQRRSFIKELGTYLFDATITDPNYTGSQNATIQVITTPVKFTQTAEQLIYTGSPLVPPIEANVNGVPLSFEFSRTGFSNFELSLVSDVGNYYFHVTSSDPGFTNSLLGRFEIVPRPVDFRLESAQLSYRAGGQLPVVISDPAGVDYDLELRREGVTVSAATSVGTYQAIIQTKDANNIGSAQLDFEVVRAVPTLQLDLPQSLVLRQATAIGISSDAESIPEIEIVAGSASWDGTTLTALDTETVVLELRLAASENFEALTQRITLPIDEPTPAIILLDGLTPTYDGSPKLPEITTTPPGLGISVVFHEPESTPINAGSYPFEVTITEPGYSGSAEGVLTIGKAPAAILIPETQAVYTGEMLNLTVATDPADLDFSVIYNQGVLPTLPIDAGVYQATVTILDPNYSGSESVTFTILPATVELTIPDATGGLLRLPNPATEPLVTREPADLAIEWTYVDLNSALPFELPGLPANDGLYQLTAKVANSNYQGSTSVLAAVGDVILQAELAETAPAVRTYTGEPVDPLQVTVSPDYFDKRLSYRGQSYGGANYGPSNTPPSDAGDYQVDLQFWYRGEVLAVIETFALTVERAEYPFESPEVNNLAISDTLDLSGLFSDPAIAVKFISGPARLDRSLEVWGYSNIVSELPDFGDATVSKIAARGSGAIALLDDGSVVSWGSGASETPAGLTNLVAVAATNDSRAALDAEGHVTVWGGNNSGEQNIPAEIQGRVTDLKGGYNHYLALLDDGSLAVWGNVEPVPDLVGRRFQRIKTEASWCAAIDEEGEAVIWGASYSNHAQTFNITLPNPVRDIGINSGGVAAVSAEGELQTWGRIWNLPEPDFDAEVSQVELGPESSVALLADGSLRPWPENGYLYQVMPPELLQPNAGIIQLATGYGTIMALVDSGKVQLTSNGILTLRATAPQSGNFSALDREFELRVGPLPPSFSLNASFELDENQPFSATPTGSSGGTSPYHWSLEGEDGSSFEVDVSSGEFTLQPQDFEQPSDADGDGVFHATLILTDATGAQFGQEFAVEVVDVETPLSSSAIELIQGPLSWSASSPGVMEFEIVYQGREIDGIASTIVDATLPPQTPGYYRVSATSMDPDFVGSRSEDFFVSGPLPADDSITKPSDASQVTISVSDLLSNDRRIDDSGRIVGGGLTVTAVTSGPGHQATLVGDSVEVVPADAGPGNFQYTVSDGSIEATATVTVLAQPEAPVITLRLLRVGTPVSDGQTTRAIHEFIATPGVRIVVEASADLANWVPVTDIVPDETGRLHLTVESNDTTPPKQMFFRARVPTPNAP